MALSGSQKAYMQARAGIGRSGAIRAGYFTYNQVVTINGVSAAVRDNSIDLVYGFNSDPDTLSFILVPGAAVPVNEQIVTFGFGSVDNREFGGTVVDVEHQMIDGVPGWMKVSCTDWQRAFNRRRASYTWLATAIDDIVIAIITTYTSGFTYHGVQRGLAVLDSFSITEGEDLMDALRRLANINFSGGVKISPYRDVRFFNVDGDLMDDAPSKPVVIATPHDLTFRKLSSQIRNRVTVESAQVAKTLAIVPSGSQSLFGVLYLLKNVSAIPIDYAQFFAPSGYLRIGTEILQYFGKSGVSGIIDRPYTVVQTQANPGDTSIAVGTGSITADGLLWTASLDIGDGFKYGTFIDYANPLNIITARLASSGGIIFDVGVLDTIPTPETAFGAVKTIIPAGTNLFLVDAIWTTDSLVYKYPLGTDVILRTVGDDAVSQATLAALEQDSNNGIHEFFIKQPTATNWQEDAKLVEAELNVFSDPIVSAEWPTQDMNARPGAPQDINIGGPDPLVTTLIITDVQVRFEGKNAPPQRMCRAGNARFESVLQSLLNPR